jgi:hypothetical protein
LIQLYTRRDLTRDSDCFLAISVRNWRIVLRHLANKPWKTTANCRGSSVFVI